MTDQEPKGRRIGERVPTGVPDPITGEEILAYAPPYLPLRPPLDRGAYAGALAEAVGALEQARAAQEGLPDLFRRACIWRECVFSSQIEGTVSSLSDIVRRARGDPELRDERLTKKQRGSLDETLRCVRALEHGLEQMRSADGLPLGIALLREVHAILMKGAQDNYAEPGEVRSKQNYIGKESEAGTVVLFTPPPADRIDGLLGNLEEQFHAEVQKGLLLEQAAILHGQFEMIHPFLDGNGRVGRILIPLLLRAHEPKREALPLVSMHLKFRRGEYHARLRGLSAGKEKDAWEQWVAFFLEAVHGACTHASSLAGRLRESFERDDARLREAGMLEGAPRLVCRALRERLSATAKDIAEDTGRNVATVYEALEKLEKIGIAEEVTGRKRDRAWLLPEQLRLLNEHTDMPHI